MMRRLVENFARSHFGLIPEVSAIFAEQDGSVFHVSVILDREDDMILDRVIEMQQQIIREFQQFEFDFSVVFQNGSPINDLFAPAEPLYLRA